MPTGRGLIVAVAVLLGVDVVQADVVRLYKGRAVKGTIIKETDDVVIVRMKTTTKTIQRSERRDRLSTSARQLVPGPGLGGQATVGHRPAANPGSGHR
jgi:hypothetical protein